VQEILNFEWRREIYTGRIGLDLPVQQPTLGQVHALLTYSRGISNTCFFATSYFSGLARCI